MGYGTIIQDMIEEALLNTHTIIICKVVSVQGNQCTVQPLNRIKALGKAAKNQAVITCVPIIKSARGDVKKGSVVVCACGERTIAETIKGKFSTPPVGHHELKDAIVIGVL